MPDKRFWLGMTHRGETKRNDKLLIGNIDTGEAMFIDLSELLTALTSDDLPEGVNKKFITPEQQTALQNLATGLLTLTEAAKHFYPRSTNPTGYLTSESTVSAANISGTIPAAQIPGLQASIIISGILNAARIPDLDASKITSGVFDLARIPDLPASKFESIALELSKYILKTSIGAINGVAPLGADARIGVGYIPNMDASKITTGILSEALFPDVFLRAADLDNYYSKDETQAFTLEEKAKLAGLESPKWKGGYLTKDALVLAYPEGAGQAWHNNEGGWEADVDGGAGLPVQRYLWDASDLQWIAQAGTGGTDTPATVKTKYESNPDTNAFQDHHKGKVEGLPAVVESTLGAQQKADAALQAAKQHATVEEFGAVGGGVTDNYSAIQDALNSNYSKIIIGKEKAQNYTVSRPLNVPSDKTIEINGTVKIQGGFQDFITSDVAIGANTVSVSGASTKYFPGQQIVLSDDNRPTQGGGTSQIRRIGSALTITAVAGDVITFEGVINTAYTVAANAKLGHCQSVFLAENKSKINIFGTGVIDQNKANQFDVEPIYLDQAGEDVRFGCGISINQSIAVYVDEGLTIQNTVLHGIQFKECAFFGVNNITADGAHDKGVLVHKSNNFSLTNIRAINSDYEDGIYLHDTCSEAFIDNIYSENCSRKGFGIGANSKNITVGKVIAKNCGKAGEFYSSENITVQSFKSVGGGTDRTGAVKPMFIIQGVTNSDFNLEVNDNILTASGVSIIGGTDNVNLKIKVKGLTASTGSGVGVTLGGASGVYPSNIILDKPEIEDNKTGISIQDGCVNIRAIGGKIEKNTTNVSNSTGDEFTAFNTKGIDSLIDGRLTLRGNSELFMEGSTVQPGILAFRSLGTPDSPLPILSNYGLYRLRIRGYDGTAFSGSKNPFFITATEDWTPTSQGYKIGFNTGKKGTNTPGIPASLTEKGFTVGVQSSDARANYDAQAAVGQTLPLFAGFDETGAIIFSVDPKGIVKGKYTNGTLIRDAVPSTVVGTGENLVKSYELPANILDANDFFRIVCGTVEKTGTVSSTICYVKISNTNDFATSTQIMQAQISGSNQAMKFERDFSIHNGLIKGMAFANNVNSDKATSFNKYDTAPIDVTQPIYVFVSIRNYGSGDTAYLNDLLITK